MQKGNDIEISSLSVRLTGRSGHRTEVIDNISMNVRQGEIVSILGPSGSGKTTILRAIMGEVAYDGVVRVSDDKRQKLSYLQQKPVLLPWRTALENAALGLELRDSVGTSSMHTTREQLREFGIGADAENRLPNELSGGMQQRVAIVRALGTNSRLLLCDEPFSAIDFVNRLRLNDVFKRRCDGSHVSVLMVTHNIDEAIFLSDRIYVINGTPGRIVGEITTQWGAFIGDAVETRSHPKFEEYFKDIWSLLRRK